MSTPFFITGLPRSRTAWLATFLTSGHTVCHHDLMGKVSGLEEFRKTMAVPHTGDSDSGLLFAHRMVNRIFPKARWVIIERDFEESVASLQRFVKGTRWEASHKMTPESKALLQLAFHDTVEAVERSGGMRIAFEDLDDEGTIRRLWDYCVDSPLFSQQRFEMWRQMRVSAIPDGEPRLPVAEIVEAFAGDLVEDT